MPHSASAVAAPRASGLYPRDDLEGPVVPRQVLLLLEEQAACASMALLRTGHSLGPVLDAMQVVYIF